MHQRHGSEGVAEAGVLGAWKYHVPDAQLPDAPQALDLRRLDQVQDQPAWNGDEAVNRVGEYLESSTQC